MPTAVRAQTADSTVSSGTTDASGAAEALSYGAPQPGGLNGSPATLPMESGQTLRERIGSALGVPFASSAGTPAVQITPAVGIQQGWTSNVLNTPGLGASYGTPGLYNQYNPANSKAEAAFFTSINPSLAVSADTQRLQLSSSYTPSLTVYEPARGQNNLAQNLIAQAHATVMPDTLFVNLSALAQQQTITGGFGPPGTVQPNRANTAQDYSISLTPYLMHRFGGYGTAQIGTSVSESAQLVPSGTVVASQPGLPEQTLSNQTATTFQEFLNLVSGENFGRLLSTINASGAQSSGAGVLSGAYEYVASYQAQYAITHAFSLLATIGWQDLHYAGLPPVNINGLLWNVGAQFTPSPDGSITVRYGRTDGINGAFVTGKYAPTARTLLTVNYSTTVSTDQQQLQTALPTATTDAAGNLVNADTGTALLGSNNFFGINPSVYRLETAAVTAALLLDRDTFQVGFNHQRQSALNTATTETIATDQIGTYGSITWQHDLSPVVQTSVLFEYGVSQAAYAGVNQKSTVLVGSGQVSYAISPTLSANLQYSHTVDSFRSPVPGFSADIVVAGLQKTF